MLTREFLDSMAQAFVFTTADENFVTIPNHLSGGSTIIDHDSICSAWIVICYEFGSAQTVLKLSFEENKLVFFGAHANLV